MKHTPAPWIIKSDFNWGDVMYSIDPQAEITKTQSKELNEVLGNIRLISKTPEMYKMLKDINTKYPLHIEGLNELLKGIENERIT